MARVCVCVCVCVSMSAYIHAYAHRIHYLAIAYAPRIHFRLRCTHYRLLYHADLKHYFSYLITLPAYASLYGHTLPPALPRIMHTSYSTACAMAYV